LAKGADEVLGNGTQELRLFEHEGGPLIKVEINLEEAPLFMLQKNEQGGEDVIERAASSLRARDTGWSSIGE
jgi:hypothetical protein